MNYRITSIPMLCALAYLAAAQVGAAERTPPGSFLAYRSASVSELVDQISRDPVVRSRYARHFHVSPEKIASALADGLQLVSLQKPMTTTSYYIGKAGKIYSKTKTLPKGAMVFAGAGGKPLLSWSCGNPLRASMLMRPLKKTEKVAGSVEEVGKPPKPVFAPAAADNVQVETKVLAQAAETVGIEPAAAVPGIASVAEPVMVASAAPIMAPGIFAAALPTVGAIIPPVVAGGGIGTLGWLGGLGALGGIAAATQHGSQSPQVGPAPVTPPIVPPVPVPEPVGLAVMMMGLGTSVAWLRRQRVS